MKTIIFCLFLIISATSFAQNENYKKSIDEHRIERNAEMKDSSRTPLKPDELKKFTALNFYEVDQNYCVKAKFIKHRKADKIDMKTSSRGQKFYNVYAHVEFILFGKTYSLNVYQSLDLMKREGFKDYLFIPFTDNTNGNETYGGGRYIDLRIPNTKEITLDFNLAYNPYCAYTTGFNCPIPPKENHLDFEVKAGEKTLWNEH